MKITTGNLSMGKGVYYFMLWWSDDLKIGIGTIDEQHKGIFDKAEDILNLEADSKPFKVKKMYRFLLNYVATHFKDEEKVMEDIGYPDLEEHKEQHIYITNELRKLVDKAIKEGITEENIDAMKLLVIEWLINHISESDRKIAVFINEKKPE